MDLVTRVRDALREQPVHPTEFERCACALLQQQYPGLSAVEGGHDFGRDADIYFPLGPDDTQGRGRLLITTGDPVANVRNGLKRMREEGVSADLIVVACTQDVNAGKRRSLEKLCTDSDLPEPHIYGQDFFVARLVHEPDWRLNLLGIRGVLGALSLKPIDIAARSTSRPPLVGRDSSLALLRGVVASGQDAVVIGVPGSGKTRLTTELVGSVAYLEEGPLDGLLDELLRYSPTAVVVDDAHTRLDGLRYLLRARAQESLPFTILATTWPDQVDLVVGELSDAQPIELDLLERSDMDAMIQSVGVTNFRARNLILNQGAGRPGWALTLCEVLISGDDGALVSGSAHLANVERHLRRTTESETAVDTLACVAALGVASTEDLFILAPLVAEAPAHMSGLMERLARNGLVEKRNEAWSLQPALRAPLIARWFFAGPANRPWSTIWAAFPDRARDLRAAAISAAEVSQSAGARAVVDGWIRELPPPRDWDADTLSLVAKYARLDKQAAKFAANAAVAILNESREVEEIHGVSYDHIGATAGNVLIRVTRQFVLPEAVSGLLDLAVGDDRPRHATPDHPLRVIKELAGSIDPDFGTNFEIRRLLLRPTLNWLAAQSSAAHWQVATEALAGVFTVEMSGTWADPGSPNSLTLAQGIDSAENLTEAMSLWPQVADALRRSRDAGAGCPPSALIPLLGLAMDWLRLSVGRAGTQVDPNDEQKRVAGEGGRRILDTLHPLLQASPGMALRAQRMIDSLEPAHPQLQLPTFEVDPELDSFARGGPWGRYLTSNEGDLSADAAAAAQRIAALGPSQGVARFNELAEQAALADDDSSAAFTAHQLRPLLDDPAAWYEAAAEAESPLLVGVALEQWFETTPATVPVDIIATSMETPEFRANVIRSVLKLSTVNEAAAAAIAAMGNEDVRALDALFALDVPNEVLKTLLQHPVRAIAASAAVSFNIGQAHGHGPELPEDWRETWRQAIRRMEVKELAHHNQWRADQLLEFVAANDPDLFEEWFTQRLDEMADRGFYAPPDPHGSDAYLAHLPSEHRFRLAARCTGQRRIGHSPLIHLIGPDRDLAERLLIDEVVSPDEMLNALTGQRNETLEQVGPLLLEHGISAAEIAATVAWKDTWWGPESAMHQELIDYFTVLESRVPSLRSVASAGRAQQESLLQQALQRERDERIGRM